MEKYRCLDLRSGIVVEKLSSADARKLYDRLHDRHDRHGSLMCENCGTSHFVLFVFFADLLIGDYFNVVGQEHDTPCLKLSDDTYRRDGKDFDVDPETWVVELLTFDN